MGALDTVRKWGKSFGSLFFEDVEERAAGIPLKSNGENADWLFSYFINGNTQSGLKFNNKDALTIPAVQQAIRIYSETIASFPWEVYEDTDNGTFKNPTHPLHILFNSEPAMQYSSYAFRKALVSNLFTYGVGIAYINRSRVTARPKEFLIIHPEDCKQWHSKETGLYYEITYRLEKDGQPVWTRNVPQSDVIYIQDMTFNGISAVSRIQQCKEVLSLAVAAIEYPAKYMANGGHFDGILSTDQPLKADDVKRISEQWGMRKGIGKAGSTPVLPFNLKYQALSSDFQQMQLIELSKFLVSEIGRIFNLPAHMLTNSEQTSSYKMEEMNANLVKYSFRPIVKNIEAEFNRKAFYNREKGRIYSRMNMDSLLRGDILTRAEVYSKLIAAKVINPNEARAQEGMNPYEGGDIYENPNTSSNNGTDGTQDI